MAQFLTPCAVIERYLEFFFAVFTELVITKDFRLCEKQ